MRLRRTLLAAVSLLGVFSASAETAELVNQPFLYHDPIVIVGKQNCTGFYIGGDGYVVTAAHCISDFQTQVTFTDGTEVTALLAVFSDNDKGFDDFAVLKITEKRVLPLKLDCGAVPGVGTDVFMTGYPGGVGGMRRLTVWGKISGPPTTWVDWTKPVVPLDISAWHGFSGSPVMRDDTKEVVGILVGIEPQQPDLAVMVPMVSRLCAILDYKPDDAMRMASGR